MLIRLTPEKVSEYWQWIAPLAVSSIPGYTERSDLTALLRSLLSGDMTCWIIPTENNKFKGMLITSFEINRAFDFQSLVVYSFYISSRFNVNIKELKQSLADLQDFAKESSCKQILTYTNDKKLFNIARKLGASHEFSILNWRI